MPDEPIRPDKPRRRWFRFSLRTLLILVAVAAIPMAWVAHERRQSEKERLVAEQLLKQGSKEVTFGGPYDSWELYLLDNPQG